MEMKEFDVKDIEIQENDESSFKDYISQLVNELRNDAEVYEKLKALKLTNGEVRDNIARLDEFRQDYNICKNCPGINKCPKQTPHISMHLTKDGNFIQAQYEPCGKIIESVRHDSRYLVKDFPNEWKDSSLKKLDLSDVRRPVIKAFANVLKGNSSRWLYLTGNHKVGKSFLLVTFANEFIALKDEQVAILSTPERIKQLADLSMNDNQAFNEEIAALSNVPLLVFDDFGEEYKNEYIRDSIILPILSEREHSSRLTFFSSEFTIKEVVQLYSVGKASGLIRSKQLANILNEMCEEEFDVSGTSYRK